MKAKLRGVFVVDPAYAVPVEVFPYRQPRDAGWTRQTHAQARAKYANQKSRGRVAGSLYAPSIRTPRPVSTCTRDSVDAHARWRDVINTGQ
jgi:hypothetical protein